MEIDYDSNFRRHFVNDPFFYNQVIRLEEPPYDFKIHLFLDKPRDADSSSQHKLLPT